MLLVPQEVIPVGFPLHHLLWFYWLAVKNSTDNPVSCVATTCNGVKKSKDGAHGTSVQRHLKQIYSEKVAIFYYMLFIPSDHRFHIKFLPESNCTGRQNF